VKGPHLKRSSLTASELTVVVAALTPAVLVSVAVPTLLAHVSTAALNPGALLPLRLPLSSAAFLLLCAGRKGKQSMKAQEPQAKK
jgi:hypothetical protein